MDNLELSQIIHNFVIIYWKNIIFLKVKYFCVCTQYKESTDHKNLQNDGQKQETHSNSTVFSKKPRCNK